MMTARSVFGLECTRKEMNERTESRPCQKEKAVDRVSNKTLPDGQTPPIGRLRKPELSQTHEDPSPGPMATRPSSMIPSLADRLSKTRGFPTPPRDGCGFIVLNNYPFSIRALKLSALLTVSCALLGLFWSQVRSRRSRYTSHPETEGSNTECIMRETESHDMIVRCSP